MLEQAIYTPDVGKPIPKLCRATGYSTKEKEIAAVSQKAVADLQAEHMMQSVGIAFTSSWKFVATEKIYERWMHHYKEVVGDKTHQHLWIESKSIM